MRLVIPIEVLQRQQDWIAVGGIFQDAHPMCEECSHCKYDIEAPQFGDAPRGDAECDLGQRPSDKPTDCPAYADQLAEAD